MNLTPDGKVALVTGGAHGIGLAISPQLAQHDATVVVTDTSPQVGEVAASFGAKGVQLDVTDEAAVRALAADVDRDCGRFDVLVSNAGISRKNGDRKFYLEEIDSDNWRRVLSVNLDSLYYTSRASVPPLKLGGSGRIVNISSQAGRGRSDLTSSHYATSKAGVIGLTRSLACDLGHFGITVTAVAPGFVESEMSGAYSPERRETAIRSIVQDIAHAVGFLASDASGFINGAVLDVNGGGFM